MFAIGTRRLAVASTQVRELVRAVALTPLPGAPSGVGGVVDVRGTIVPVYDLSDRVGVLVRPIRPSDHLLVCDAGAHGTVAVRADRVLEIRGGFEPADLLPPTSMPAADPLVASLVRLPDGVVVLCDLGAFLSTSDAAAVARALVALDQTGVT